MGCNTSKESVQPAAEEAKEDVKNGDIPKSGEGGTSEAESGKGTEKEARKETKEEEKGEKESRREAKEDGEDGNSAVKSKEDAATTIQAAFRGHHARKSMKETETTTKQPETRSEPEPTKEQLQDEFRADDKELCNAATKIQASFRGHMSRKEQQATAIGKSAMEFVDNTAAKIEEKMADAVNELEGIDLTDPDLHKAATKIQASFRGHKVRQEVTVAPSAEDEKK